MDYLDCCLYPLLEQRSRECPLIVLPLRWSAPVDRQERCLPSRRLPYSKETTCLRSSSGQGLSLNLMPPKEGFLPMFENLLYCSRCHVYFQRMKWCRRPHLQKSIFLNFSYNNSLSCRIFHWYEPWWAEQFSFLNPVFSTHSDPPL